jgi:hypothetical protein
MMKTALNILSFVLLVVDAGAEPGGWRLALQKWLFWPTCVPKRTETHDGPFEVPKLACAMFYNAPAVASAQIGKELRKNALRAPRKTEATWKDMCKQERGDLSVHFNAFRKAFRP